METEFNEKQLYIMDKALALFVNVGYSSSSVRAVAKAAGVNVAMIFYYFGSKEKLLEAIFTRHLQALERKWVEIEGLQKEGEPLYNLELFVDGFLGLANESQNFFRLMLRQSTLLVHDGFRFAKIAILKRVMENLITKNVNIGIEKGIFNKEVDPEFVMQFTTGTFFHTMIKYDLNNSSNPMADVSEKEIKGLNKNLKFILKAYLKYGIQ
ncbi:MAG: hypothetical protein DI598_15850 [Pseudopedobacter saltans]|uniref:HTH tetR-type domain-containing protein n=1 Tax=Pseudopedobacter saltans TaxID=151895 RepID=A0A2W5ELB0_9SPHI|nr:MAG: hypothetical protein DI598_15850 [Pseudopedobacter saltans]